MVDLEERIRRHVDAQLLLVDPVTADEARSRAHGPRASTMWEGPTRWFAVAALVLAVTGIVAALAVRDRSQDSPRASVVDAGQDPDLTLDGLRDYQLQLLNGREPTDAELQARYTGTFLAAISPDKFRSTQRSLEERGHWRIAGEVERRDDTVLAVQLIAADGTQARLTMHRAASGKLDASTILLAQACAPAVTIDSTLEPALRSHLDWAMALLASEKDPSDAELRDHLAPSFLEMVPLGEFRSGLGQLRALGPYSLRSYEGAPNRIQLAARVGLRTGEEARLSLSIEPREPHRITGFSIFTQAPCTVSDDN